MFNRRAISILFSASFELPALRVVMPAKTGNLEAKEMGRKKSSIIAGSIDDESRKSIY